MRSIWWLALVTLGACVVENNAGPSTLVRVDDEPAGANCEYGGVAVNTGRDKNKNDTLDDSEITSTEYVCNGGSDVRCPQGAMVHDGTVTIRTQADFAQLAGIGCVDGDLIVAGLAGDIAALPDLTTVTGGVIIAGNADITSLNGFSALKNVGQSYLLQGNDALTDISHLATLDAVASIFLIGNNSLADLAGLSTLNELEVSLTVANNPALTSLHGLENVFTTKSWLAIRSNRNLTDISALANVRSSTVLDLSGNTSLQTIDLPGLEKVDVRFIIDQNPALTTVTLPKLVTLGDVLTISSNPVLTSVSMPELLTTGAMTIHNNVTLSTVSAPTLGYIVGDLSFSNMPALTSLDFTALSVVGGTLRVYTVSPWSFAGFSSLGSLGHLWIVNAGMTSFSGLSALSRIAGDMTVSANPQLTTFTGLDSMADVGGNLTITSNAMLSPAVAQAFANQVTVHGTTTIN